MAQPTAIHTPLMEPARVKVEAALLRALPALQPPKCDVYLAGAGAGTGRRIAAGTTPKDIIGPLCDAMTSTSFWQSSVQAMIAAGITEFFEVGSSKQLKAMMKRIDADMWTKTQAVEF